MSEARFNVRCTLAVHADFQAYCDGFHCSLGEGLEQLLKLAQSVEGPQQVEQTVKRLIAHNKHVRRQSTAHQIPEAIVYIGKTYVQMEGHVSFRSIEEYWRDHETEIRQHNEANGFFTPEEGRQHNRQRSKYVQDVNALAQMRETSKMQMKDDHERV